MKKHPTTSDEMVKLAQHHTHRAQAARHNNQPNLAKRELELAEAARNAAQALRLQEDALIVAALD